MYNQFVMAFFACFLVALPTIVWCMESEGGNSELSGSNARNHDVQKRYIKFDEDINSTAGCYRIGSKRVCRLKLGPGSVALDVNKTYTGFTLYHKDGGVDVGDDVGLMHFVEGSISASYAVNCNPPTFHAGAYYAIYKKCPKSSTGLVASGYCYNPAKNRIGYNSGTFNSITNTYLAMAYYENDKLERNMNPREQVMLEKCCNKWLFEGFPVTDIWSCDFADFPPVMASLQTHRRTAQCPECAPGQCSNVTGPGSESGAGTPWGRSGVTKYAALLLAAANILWRYLY